jgi:hypothetical protein
LQENALDAFVGGRCLQEFTQYDEATKNGEIAPCSAMDVLTAADDAVQLVDKSKPKKPRGSKKPHRSMYTTADDGTVQQSTFGAASAVADQGK